jgi:DNA invertase Pin-like site-specific DNA recombinase
MASGAADATSGPMPRPIRRRRKSGADRGLPDDAELTKLAEVYLNRQRALWPEMVKVDLLAAPTEDILRAMVEDFKRRHRGGAFSSEPVRVFLRWARKVAGSYCRFSCDNSNPASIMDQLEKCLIKAHEHKCFIPWQYVFCDYSRSGLFSSRQGYRSYKAVLQNSCHPVTATYIDDFTRASRNEIEWWLLATTCKKLRKGLFGASDGFNLDDPNADVHITIFGLVSRLFIKSLREKVRRGMHGAAERGGSLGKLALGLTRRPKVDSHGVVVLGQDGGPKYERCIDESTRSDVELLYRLFGVEKLSLMECARRFNEKGVDGWSGWTVGGIKKLLANPIYVGVVIWNQSFTDVDPESNKAVKVQNPMSDWVYSYEPRLAFISHDLWFAVQDRLHAMKIASPLTGRRPSRNQASASTLLSGTLFCEYCGEELKLIRSTQKYKQLGCENGSNHRHGCKLSSSKSTRVIEKGILAYLCQSLLTDEALQQVVNLANQYLVEQAARPKTDTKPLEAKVRGNKGRIKKLVQAIEDEPDSNVRSTFLVRIRELQSEVDDLQAKMKDASAANSMPVEPICLESLQALLGRVPDLFNQGTAEAAEVIRGITGPISVRQEKFVGKTKGARWIATFKPDVVKLLAMVAKKANYPDSVTLEYLCSQNWITASSVSISIDKGARYESLGPQVLAMQARGVPNTTIAAKVGATLWTVRSSARFESSGERPATVRNGPPKGGKRISRYKDLSPEVVRLRDDEGLSVVEIAKRRKVSEGTVRRAYKFGRPDLVDYEVENSLPINGDGGSS